MHDALAVKRTTCEHLAKYGSFQSEYGFQSAGSVPIAWAWKVCMPETSTSVFIVPSDRVKGKQDNPALLGHKSRRVTTYCAQEGPHGLLAPAKKVSDGKFAKAPNW